MADELVKQVLVRAVQQAYEAWAVEHPSLAAVIDRITLTNRATESLRDSQAYRQAVAAYHQSQNDLELLNQLTELATPIVRTVLGL